MTSPTTINLISAQSLIDTGHYARADALIRAALTEGATMAYRTHAEAYTMRGVSNTEDIIDSRRIIERLEELEAQEQYAVDAIEDEESAETTAEVDGEAFYGLDTDEAEEYLSLKRLQEEASGCAPDWLYGAALIRDSYFETYAQELAEDIGAINSDASWPNSCIDWEQAARELQQDYTLVNYDDEEYWIR